MTTKKKKAKFFKAFFKAGVKSPSMIWKVYKEMKKGIIPVEVFDKMTKKYGIKVEYSYDCDPDYPESYYIDEVIVKGKKASFKIIGTSICDFVKY